MQLQSVNFDIDRQEYYTQKTFSQIIDECKKSKRYFIVAKVIDSSGSSLWVDGPSFARSFTSYNITTNPLSGAKIVEALFFKRHFTEEAITQVCDLKGFSDPRQMHRHFVIANDPEAPSENVRISERVLGLAWNNSDLLKKSADKGDFIAQLSIAEAYDRDGNAAESLRYYNLAVQNAGFKTMAFQNQELISKAMAKLSVKLTPNKSIDLSVHAYGSLKPKKLDFNDYTDPQSIYKHCADLIFKIFEGRLTLQVLFHVLKVYEMSLTLYIPAADEEKLPWLYACIKRAVELAELPQAGLYESFAERMKKCGNSIPAEEICEKYYGKVKEKSAAAKCGLFASFSNQNDDSDTSYMAIQMYARYLMKYRVCEDVEVIQNCFTLARGIRQGNIQVEKYTSIITAAAFEVNDPRMLLVKFVDIAAIKRRLS